MSGNDSLTAAYGNFIIERMDPFNDGEVPREFADFGQLHDSLNHEKVNYLITEFTFSGKGTTDDHIGCICTEVIINEKEIPFIRFKLEVIRAGLHRLTMVQGCDNHYTLNMKNKKNKP